MFQFQNSNYEALFHIVTGKLADHFSAILGMPFLKQNNIIINCGDNKITTNAKITSVKQNRVCSPESRYNNGAQADQNSVRKNVNKGRNGHPSTNMPAQVSAMLPPSVDLNFHDFGVENMCNNIEGINNNTVPKSLYFEEHNQACSREREPINHPYGQLNDIVRQNKNANTDNSMFTGTPTICAVTNLVLEGSNQNSTCNNSVNSIHRQNLIQENVVNNETIISNQINEQDSLADSDQISCVKSKSAINISSAILVKKVVIPPQSKIIAEIKPYRKNFITDNEPVIIEPLQKRLEDGVLLSRTICSKEHGLFVSFINLSDNSIMLNKGMRIAKILKCIDSTNDNFDSNYPCYNLNAQDPIVDFDHADLTWSSEINLDHLEPTIKEKVKEFLDKNKDVFASSVLDLPGCDTVMHTVKLKSNVPVKSKAYRVPHNLKHELETQLDMLLKADIISPSISEFASPVILVKKADGSYRLAVDFRKLNKDLIKDSYPIPNITDSVDALSGSNYFSTLDLTSGFFQQVLDPQDRHKTAIITHKGLFQFNRNCFGLSNSGPNFQRLMNAIFGDLGNLGILVYIDDIVIASKDLESHFQKLETVFNRLRQHGLKLKPSKCLFLSDKINYLGFEISKGQVYPVNKNIEIIEKFKAPKSRKAVRSFIGTVSFYRKFIPDFSKRAKNLINLTKENGRFQWNDAAQAEFDDLKAALISKPCLALPNFNKPFHLYTDASGEALGAVLSQYDDDNQLHPVAFASRKLKEVESRYSATERELLAAVWATNHFKCYLANVEFFFYTDHAPLTYMLNIKDPTSRMAKWICTLSDFMIKPVYIQGKCNGVADFLSRYVNYTNIETHSGNLNFCVQVEKPNVIEIQDTFIEKIKTLQKTDSKCCQIVNKLTENRTVKPAYLKFFLKDDLLLCEDTRDLPVMNNKIKLVVPKELVPQVFSLTHESLAACHQGFQKTIGRIREHFYWPGMSAHVRHLVDSCISCQQRRAYKANQVAPLQRMPTPNFPFNKVHSDCIGPLPPSLSGNRFIITYIDSFSKWPEAYAVSSITADVVAETLADFISRYGAPTYLTTDKGPNYLAEAIEKVYKQFGIKHFTTTAYHAAGNGMIERQNRTLANALCHIVDENQMDWDSKLKFALLAMRTAVHSATQLTPAAVMYGRNLNLPYTLFAQQPNFSYNDAPSYCDSLIPALQKVYAQVYNNLVKASETQEKYYNKKSVNKNIQVGTLVWLYTPVIGKNMTKKFTKPNTGPYTVIEKLSEVNFKIALESNPSKTQVVHVNRLTPVKNRLMFNEASVPQEDALGQTSEGDIGLTAPIEQSNDIWDFSAARERRRRRRNFAIPCNYRKQNLNIETNANANDQADILQSDTQSVTSEGEANTEVLQDQENYTGDNEENLISGSQVDARESAPVREISDCEIIEEHSSQASSHRYPLRRVPARSLRPRK